MRARAIRSIPETDRHRAFMPGDFLDAMNKEDISKYVAEHMAAWYLEDKPQTKKARNAVKGKDEDLEE